MMAMDTAIGPDNPKVKKMFELPLSLANALEEAAILFRVSQVSLAQKAIERHLTQIEAGLIPASTESETQQQTLQPHLESEQMRATLRDVIAEVFVHSIAVPINSRHRTQLDVLARDLGYPETAGLLEDLGRRALENPRDAENFLFSQYKKAGMDLAKDFEEPVKSPTVSANRKKKPPKTGT